MVFGRDGVGRVGAPPGCDELVVVHQDVRVVICAFGRVTNAVDEGERLREIAKRERSLERAVHLCPAGWGMRIHHFGRMMP